MKKQGTIILSILIIIFGYIIFNFINYRTKYAVSDAGFVKSDSMITLSFKVGGKVIFLEPKEASHIKKGQIIAKIDPKDYQVQLQKIQNEINSLQNKVKSLIINKQTTQQELDINEIISFNNIQILQKQIKALEFQIASNKENLNKLSIDEHRYKSLTKGNIVAKDKYESIQTQKRAINNIIKSQYENLKSMQIQLDNAKQNLKLSKIKQNNIKQLAFEIKALQDSIKSLQSTKQDIQNKISYCNLVSPINGIVAKKFINNFKVINSGYPIYSIVDPTDLHIEVLLSEKKLQGIKIGNKAIITIDATNKKYQGIVEAILPASLATFSLVPRDIASGEFTKLDQRFNVRIKLLNIDNDLKVGMGATVAIKRTK